MPLRWNDPALWFNLAGVMAAYQPVGAPDALSARRNMARGGDNRYQAGVGTAPAWTASRGWVFTAASSQYLTTGLTSFEGWSALISFSQLANRDSGIYIFGTSNGVYASARFGIQTRISDTIAENGGQLTVASEASTSGVYGLAGQTAYINGAALTGTIPSWSGTQPEALYIGARNSNGSAAGFASVVVSAFAVYARTLSAAEVWHASRQMAYCAFNSAWNVWAPQRRWFFVPPPPPAAATPVLSTIYINTADIGDTSLFDDVSGAAVSSTYARTGTYSFKLDGADYAQANLTSSATKYTKFGLLVTATPAVDALLCAWQEDGTEHVSLYLTDKLTLQMRQGSTIIQTSPTTLETATWYCVETKIVVHTATGQFQVRIDGVDDMSAIGINTDADVDGAINEIRFESPVDDTYIDDIVVREDQWCGTGGVNVIVPTAAGTVEEWTGDYADVDDLPPSFTDYIDVTTESGSDQTFRHGGLSGGYDVDVVGVFAKGKLDAESAEIQFYALVRSALVDNVGYAQTLDTIGVYARLLMTTDPNGTVAWTTHTVNNALQIGVRA